MNLQYTIPTLTYKPMCRLLTSLFFFTYIYCGFTFNAWMIKQRIQRQRVVTKVVTLQSSAYVGLIFQLLLTILFIYDCLKHIFLSLHRQTKAHAGTEYLCHKNKTYRDALKKNKQFWNLNRYKKYSFLTLAQPAIKHIKMNSVELSLDSESFHFSVVTERDRKRERTES